MILQLLSNFTKKVQDVFSAVFLNIFSNDSKFFLTVTLVFSFLLIFSTTNAQVNKVPEIKSVVINFSEIENYDKTHPQPKREEIGNEREENEEEEILPVYEVTDTTGMQHDPYGVMEETVPPAGNDQANAPLLTFNGIDDNSTFIPPDVNGAVGPNHVMTTLNSQVRIQNLTGVTISTVNLSSFWASLGNPSTFDPKILYEPYNGRWIFTCAANGDAANSAVLIGVSQTDNPTGAWNLYSVDADASNTNWFDFPSLGFNKDWIVVTGNLFNISTGSFSTGQLYIFKKADLYNHVAVPAVTISTPSAATLSPAATYDNSISTLYVLQRWNGNSGGSGFIRLYTITGAIGSEVLSAGVLISTPNPWSGGPPTENFGPQTGTTNKIAENDDRMQNVIYRNGSIWGVHTVFLPTSGVTRSALQWWQVSPAGAIQQRGRIDDATGAQHFCFPSIAVNTSNDALIGYAKFSTTTFASGAYVLRASTDAVNTFQPEFVYKAGLNTYFKTFSGTRNRWGDYTATMTDPNGTDFWTVQEYANSTADRWGTYWAKVEAPCTHVTPTISIAAGPSTAVCTGTPVTFTATPTNQGSAPVYQWKKNGANVGTNSTTYTDNTLTNGQIISCTLTSNVSCITSNPATSNNIVMTIVTNLSDNNACTTDACNTSTGNVTHTAVVINDNDACTTDACNTTTGAVTHTPAVTDDNNACTTDGCDTGTGVYHISQSTDDGNACTTDACNTSTGAITHTPATIDDGNSCTIDGCDTATGVYHTQTCSVYNAYIKNINYIDCKNLEFEVWLEWTGSSVQKLQFIQAGISFNYIGLANGGTLTGSFQPGSADPALPAVQQAPNWNVNQSSKQIRLLAAIATPSVTAVPIPAPGGYRIGKFKLTNTVNFNQGETPNFVWRFETGTSTTTKTLLSTYLNGATTATDITFAANHSVVANPAFNYACNATLSTKLFIQGYYSGGGLMPSLLYNLFPGTHVNDDCDTVTVELHSAISPYPVFISSKAILKTNGNVAVTFPFLVDNNSYYIGIRHRNSIETWSKMPVMMSQVTNYQFSPLQTTAYGDNLVETIDQMGWAIWNGDVNQDGAVDGSDFLVMDISIQNGDGGYEVSDINGDGAVDGTDFLILDPNIQIGVGMLIP
jgi:hypothetical protein